MSSRKDAPIAPIAIRSLGELRDADPSGSSERVRPQDVGRSRAYWMPRWSRRSLPSRAGWRPMRAGRRTSSGPLPAVGSTCSRHAR